MKEKLPPAFFKGKLHGFTVRLPTSLLERIDAVLGDRIKKHIPFRIVEASVTKSESCVDVGGAA